MVLTGNFSRTLDEKLRVAIPKELRDAADLPSGGVVYATQGTDGSLAVYPEKTFSQLADRLSAGSPTAPAMRDYNRLFFSNARRLEVDSQGRVRIPSELAAHAGLTKEKEAMLLGIRDHMELWDRERWEAYRQEKSPQYDTLAAEAFRHPGA